MQSVMTHSFSRIPRAEIPRSTFDRSHGHKTTFNAGYLVPVFWDFALPGDTFNMRMSAFARMATPLKPVMDNIFLESFFFSVPVRLVWDNWVKFCGEQVDPGDSTDYLIPQFTETLWDVGSISDYFGMPILTTITVNSLWHRAYNLIWNEWFRDQNIQDSLHVDKDDGPDDPGFYQLQRRGKRHDYFTSALPFPQKGPDVLLPLGVSAPLIGTGNLTVPGQNVAFTSDGSATGVEAIAGASPNLQSMYPTTPANTGVQTILASVPAGTIPFSTVAAGMVVDLTAATAATVNDIRLAVQLQKFYERDARGGTRYPEVVLAHFGVSTPTQGWRSEYLGGGSTPVNIHPIAQTSEDGATPQGNLAAFATASMNNHSFTKSFTEHCLVIGLCSVRADLTYQYGLNRMFTVRTREDLYWPVFSHLGEQEVLNREIFVQSTSADLEVFGYQERHAEYRYKPSIITGKFRSNATGTLDIWHLAQEFTALPTLSPEFIVENPPIERVIAVPTEPHFLFDSYFDFKCARPMPVYSVPGLMDHF